MQQRPCPKSQHQRLYHPKNDVSKAVMCVVAPRTHIGQVERVVKLIDENGVVLKTDTR